MTNKYTSEHFSELLNDLCSACSMIGYATSGNERQNHRATKDKIKAEIIDAIAALLRERESAEPVAWMTHHDAPMLFPTERECAEYCADDERPIPLYTHPKRESAKAAVTDDVVHEAIEAYVISDKAAGVPRFDAFKVALKAVAPMLVSARVPDQTVDMLQDAWRDISKISGSALLAGEKKSQTAEQRGIVYGLACSALAAVGCVYQEITGKSPMLTAAPKTEKE